MARVTLIDIARAAGISKAAASYALARRRDKVSHDLIERVAGIAARLGWQPNSAARSLRSGSFQRIALLVEDRYRFGHVPLLLLAGMLETLGPQRFDLMLVAAPEFGPRDWVPRLVQEASVDGIALFWDRPLLPVWYPELAGRGLPLLTVNLGGDQHDVSPDEAAGGALLGRFLAAQGRRRLGWSAYWQRHLGAAHRHFSVVDRAAGLEAGSGQTLIEGPAFPEGGAGDAKPPPPTDAMLSRWRSDLRDWLRRPDRPEAIVCYDQTNLIEVAHAALAIGPDLAGSLCLAVFADQPVELPGLDVLTVVLPQREVGVMVATELLARSRGEEAKTRPLRPLPRLMRGQHRLDS